MVAHCSAHEIQRPWLCVRITVYAVMSVIGLNAYAKEVGLVMIVLIVALLLLLLLPKAAKGEVFETLHCMI